MDGMGNENGVVFFHGFDWHWDWALIHILDVTDWPEQTGVYENLRRR